MKKEKMRVFQGLVNYGTQAGMFAKELRNQGVEALSVIHADSFMRIADINIRYDYKDDSRVVRHLKRMWIRFSAFFKFNVFHFYSAKSLWPYNIDLLFYKLCGKKVVMEYLGSDVDLWLGYNGVDWRGRKLNRVAKVRLVRRQAKLVNKQLTCCPPLYEFVDNSIILPLALDLTNYSYTPRSNTTGVLTIMHCPTNRMGKRSDYIEAALDMLKQDGYVFNYKCVMNVTHEQLKEEYKDSDIVIDQLNRWYGTAAVEAMALGRPVICTIYPHYCHYDERFESLPIINADIYNIYSVLKDVLDGKYDLKAIGKASREFIEKAHDLKIVTKQLIDIYESL